MIEILLKSNIDTNGADAEGNSALHWALRTSSIGSSQHEKQNRSLFLSIALACKTRLKFLLKISFLFVL